MSGCVEEYPILELTQGDTRLVLNGWNREEFPDDNNYELKCYKDGKWVWQTYFNGTSMLGLLVQFLLNERQENRRLIESYKQVIKDMK